MSYIGSVVLSIFDNELDAFIIMSHIIFNIYPKGFFDDDERYLIYHQELTVFGIVVYNNRHLIFKNYQGEDHGTDMQSSIKVCKHIAKVFYKYLFINLCN